MKNCLNFWDIREEQLGITEVRYKDERHKM